MLVRLRKEVALSPFLNFDVEMMMMMYWCVG